VTETIELTEAPAQDPRLEHRCTCGAPRWRHAGKAGGGRCLGHTDTVVPAPCPTVCERFRWDSDDRLMRRAVAAADDEPSVALRRYHGARDRRRTRDKAAHGDGFSVGPSDHGSCLKAVEYRERPPEGYEPKPVAKDAANVGTMLHEEYTRARRLTYPWRRFKVTVLVPGLDRPGEADEVDYLIGRVTDYKSAGDWKWEKVGKEGPPESEWKQLATYGFGIAAADPTFTPNDLELVYMNRENGRTERYVRPYDEAYALAAVTELLKVLDALEEGRELPRQRAGEELLGPTVNALCARYCPAVNHCWDLPNVPAERTPEGWLYARDDEDGAITATLETYDANRAVAKDAETQKDYARTLVVGVEPGRYGDMTLAWSGGNLGEPKPDDKARLAQLKDELDEAHRAGRPPRAPVDLPYPMVRKRSNVTIRVGRVRAAQLEKEKREREQS
jgi:hypothetical protein